MSAGTAVVEKLSAELDVLAAVDPAVLADGDAMVDLHRQLERLAAVTTRASAPSTPPGPGSPTVPTRPRLADGTVVSPGSFRPWLDQSWIERVVFDGPSRVTDVGLTRRLFSGATRRAVEIRDRECFHPYCHLPAADCDVDHVQRWAAGGLTTQANGRPACGLHNRARQRGP